jgi:ferredoxin-NADP reductase
MKLKLKEIKEEIKGVKTFVFLPEGELKWTAGQFLHYVLHHRPTDDRGSDRWFTIASAPHEEVIKITTRIDPERSSTFKNELQRLNVGDNIEISEVEGDFVIEDPSKEFVFIAGGIGITPFYAIIKDLVYKKQPLNITLLYANRDKNIVYQGEFEKISKENPTFKIHYIISPEKISREKISEILPNFQNKIFYVSGPEPMVDSLGNELIGLEVADDQIKQDWFPGYPEE